MHSFVNMCMPSWPFHIAYTPISMLIPPKSLSCWQCFLKKETWHLFDMTNRNENRNQVNRANERSKKKVMEYNKLPSGFACRHPPTPQYPQDITYWNSWERFAFLAHSMSLRQGWRPHCWTPSASTRRSVLLDSSSHNPHPAGPVVVGQWVLECNNIWRATGS